MNPPYDDVARLYHLFYPDWEGSIRRQAEALDRVLSSRLADGPYSILDVSCGIGTQSLGLAARGHEVTGSDLSEQAVARARTEAEKRGLSISWSVSDMRHCDRHHSRRFEAVISCDNSIPHLPSNVEILEALRAFRRCLEPGGAVLISIRDYTKEERSDTPQLRPYGVRETDQGRVFVFQVWDWDAGGTHYDLAMVFVEESPNGTARTTLSRSRYFAIEVPVLATLLEEAGFVDVEVSTGFFQPLLIGRQP